MGRIVDTNNMVVKKHGKVGKLYLPASMIGKTVRVVAVGETIEPITVEPKEQIKQQKTPPLFIDKEIDYSKILLCMNGEVCSRDGSIINNRICADCHKKIYKPNP